LRRKALVGLAALDTAVNLAVCDTAVVFLRVKRKKLGAVFLRKIEVALFAASIWERNFSLSFQYAFMKKRLTKKSRKSHLDLFFLFGFGAQTIKRACSQQHARGLF
jgi:hypothetical protein